MGRNQKLNKKVRAALFFVQEQVFITHMHGGENLAPFFLNCCGPYATGGGVLVLGKVCIGCVQLHATFCKRMGEISLSLLSCAAACLRVAPESPRKGSLFQLIIYPKTAMLTQVMYA